MRKLVLTVLLLVFTSTNAFAATAKINVNGLVCDFCARALEKVFSKKEEVKNIDVNLETKIITVNFNEGQILSDEVLEQSITDSGYDFVGITWEGSEESAKEKLQEDKIDE
jgi:copper chaperone CopZ